MGPAPSHDRHNVCQVESEAAPEKVRRHMGRGGRRVQDVSGNFVTSIAGDLIHCSRNLPIKIMSFPTPLNEGWADTDVCY